MQKEFAQMNFFFNFVFALLELVFAKKNKIKKRINKEKIIVTNTVSEFNDCKRTLEKKLFLLMKIFNISIKKIKFLSLILIFSK